LLIVAVDLTLPVILACFFILLFALIIADAAIFIVIIMTVD